MKPLFHKPDTSLEKLAYRTKLGSNPNDWGMEVLDAVYKEHPYLKSYSVDVDIKDKDEGSGTAVGTVIVYPTMMTKEAAAAKQRVISMPIIIKEREMAPLDVYMGGEEGTPHPASQEDIESTLQSPELFEGPEPRRSGRGGRGALDLSVPSRFGTMGSGQGYGMGGADQSSGSLMKTASVWAGIGPRLDLEKLAAYLKPVAHSIEPTVREVAAAVDAGTVGPSDADVVQVSGKPGNLMVKTASCGAYSPVAKRIDDDAAQKLVGDRWGELAERGYVTLVSNPVDDIDQLEKLASVQEASVGEVSIGGRRVRASIFPEVRTLHHTQLPGTLVLGDGWFAEAEKVAAANTIMHPGIEPFRPSGRVVPVDGQGVAYEPLLIKSFVGSFEKHACVATRLGSGQDIVIHFFPELQKIAHVGGNEYAFPVPGAYMGFLPYPDVDSRKTIDDAMVQDAAFDLRRMPSMVKVASDGEAWRLWGPARIQGEYDEAGVMFALGAAGVAPDRARGMLKHASLYREAVEFSNVRDIEEATPAPPRDLAPRSTTWRDAVAYLFNEDGQELMKSAGVRMKGQSPSSLLSLDFVTPENASMYVSYLPDLEKAASHLAELLVASRLGYDDIRERSAKNAMTQLQSVVTDLRELDHKVH